ncbi:MAG: preprotein translocase subunit SecE [Oscillospiraceae bacterium]|nr:preprotein translocase subunit SecE [Oscillospiraceae bacterium]
MSKENEKNDIEVDEIKESAKESDGKVSKDKKAVQKKPTEKSTKKPDANKKSKRSPLKWFKDARAEFKKVTWPTSKQVVKNTSVVLTMLAVAGIAVWGLDKLLDFLLRLIINPV